MRIAIASSGLGYVARGIETWAWDTAVALREQGEDVTLYCGGPLATPAVDEDGVLFTRVVPLWSLPRATPLCRRLTAMTPRFGWRWGLKTVYGWEQFSFWWRLWWRLRRDKMDILHVQDPMVASWCRAFRRCGLVRTKEILVHATEEPVEFFRPFDYVQHLGPWHFRQALDAVSVEPVASDEGGGGSKEKPFWDVVSNFVDTDIFRPRRPAGAEAGHGRVAKESMRWDLAIPDQAFVVGTAAAVKRDHKRIDFLIREFGRYSRASGAAPWLLVAGARTEQSDSIVDLPESMGNGQSRILFDLPREAMPAFFRTLDVFVLSSLFEMMPIAVLEALATGLPVVAHRHPVFEWLVGDGGELIDMAQEGALAAFLAGVTSEWIAEKGRAARERAEQMFSKPAVIRDYVAYYRRVMADTPTG